MQKMSFNIVEMLLEKDANLTIKNKIGQTALDMFNNKDTKEQSQFLKRLTKESKLSQQNIDLINKKLVDIDMNNLAMGLKQKWIDAQNNVLIDKERLKAFHKKIAEKTKETHDIMLTLPEKLDTSVDRVLNYSDGSEIDLSNTSNNDQEILPFAEYENFLYDVPLDVFYNVS